MLAEVVLDGNADELAILERHYRQSLPIEGGYSDFLNVFSMHGIFHDYSTANLFNHLFYNFLFVN